ncbi:MAG: hypothetical protein ABSD49_11380 [Candidatus Bathyarchaeia archaeon]
MEESTELTEGSRGQLVQTIPGSAGHAGTAQVLESQLGSQRRRTRAAGLVGYMLLGMGLLAVAVSILFSSTILAFIGLGLAFWGMLMFFVRPHNYVRSDLLNATAMSSLKTIDNIMLDMGYREKGVYIPTEGPDRTVVFVPTEPFSAIPTAADVAGKTSLTDPAGLLVVPPGLALANLIEKKLGFKVKDCGVETLIRSLPKVLIEDLEIVRDIQTEVKGDQVEFKLIDSIYADFCREARDSSRRCGLGCPMCSALACILATASGKPVLFDEDRESSDKKTTTSSYQLLTQPRL